jgi:origin recognition complex subunit 3
MINVYDWFESFKSVLDTQSELIKTQAAESASPKKGKGKAKAKSATTEEERDDDKWNVEVQARFIRALHELDYLGFIKHTGRKADHVQRTVFDIDDPQ